MEEPLKDLRNRVLAAYFSSPPTMALLVGLTLWALVALAGFLRSRGNDRLRLKALAHLLAAATFFWVFLGLSVVICIGLAETLHYDYTAAKIALAGATLGGLALALLAAYAVRAVAPQRALAALASKEAPVPSWLEDRWRNLRALWRRPAARLHVSLEPEPISWAVDRDGGHVVVSQSLLVLLEREEVEAVIGHELAHLAHGDANSRVLERALSRFLFFDPVSRLAAPASNRVREYLADSDSAVTLGAHRHLAAALAKIGRALGDANLSDPLPMSVVGAGGGILDYHPPLGKRIERLLRGL